MQGEWRNRGDGALPIFGPDQPRRSFRTFNVIDDFARDALAIEIDFSISGGRVVRMREQLCEWHGKPVMTQRFLHRSSR